MIVGIIVGGMVVIGVILFPYIAYQLLKLFIDCIIADKLREGLDEFQQKIEELEKALHGKTHR